MEKVAEKIIPKVKAEEEEEEEDLVDPAVAEEEEDLVDPAVAIKEKCAEDHCQKYKDRLEECNTRVRSKTKTSETCMEEVIDFYHCVDHCAGPKIFSHLK